MTITTDQAMDVLPAAVAMFEKLDMKTFIGAFRKDTSNMTKEQKEALQNEAGVALVTHVLKSFKAIKAEVIEILAVIEGKAEDEIRSRPFMETWAAFSGLIQDKELMAFFQQAMR